MRMRRRRRSRMRMRMRMRRMRRMMMMMTTTKRSRCCCVLASFAADVAMGSLMGPGCAILRFRAPGLRSQTSSPTSDTAEAMMSTARSPSARKPYTPKAQDKICATFQAKPVESIAPASRKPQQPRREDPARLLPIQGFGFRVQGHRVRGTRLSCWQEISAPDTEPRTSSDEIVFLLRPGTVSSGFRASGFKGFRILHRLL